MSGAGDKKTDVTVQLPDEVLGHVFGFLSLRDKLRSEAVNHKFQRCIHQELKANPLPLEYNIGIQKLARYPVSPEQLCGAVQTLVKKAKFSSVALSFRDSPDCLKQLDSVLSLLISEAQCLTKVTSFATDSLPVLYPMKRLAEMLIQPNALRKLNLWFVNESYGTRPTLGLDELFDALVHNGSLLEYIHLELRDVDVQFAPLFDSLARLPALRKCNIDCESLKASTQVAQFVPAVTSMFRMSEVNISVMLDRLSLSNAGFPRGCQFVNMIRQIQKIHRGLAIDINPLYSLTLSLGNASICIYWDSGDVDVRLFKSLRCLTL